MGVNSDPLLQMAGISKTYVQGHWWEKQFHLKALDGVDLSLEKGKTLALVGKSGSGKTTLAMCAALLELPDSGKIWFHGSDVLSLEKRERVLLRPRIQIIFQDSTALPARYTAGQIIEEPLVIQSRSSPKERADLVSELMEKVGLSPKWRNRLPDQFSGGQRQRLAIARSLTLQPNLLILDEPFVGLDISTRGQIINLLLDLQANNSLAYLYISHDLELVRHFSDSVAVMNQGKIVEQGSVSDLLRSRADPNAHSWFRHGGPRQTASVRLGFVDKVNIDTSNRQSCGRIEGSLLGSFGRMTPRHCWRWFSSGRGSLDEV
jgi:ABC-type glutathione transport system ATPase component